MAGFHRIMGWKDDQQQSGAAPGSRARHSAVLLLAAALILALLGSVAHYQYGNAGTVAAAAAVGVCLAGVLASLWAGSLFPGPNQALARVLVGMLLRMGVPLTTALVLVVRQAEVLQSGFLLWLVAGYLPLLGLEIYLTLPPGFRHRSCPRQPAS
jgi:hypothetical protein